MCYNRMAMVSSKLVFSRRRTLALEIDRDGQLIVRAPYGTPKIYIDRFVAEKKEWIETHAARMRRRRARYGALTLREGETLPILGRNVTLRMTEENGISFKETSEELFFPVTAGKGGPAALFVRAFKGVFTAPCQPLRCPYAASRTALFFIQGTDTVGFMQQPGTSAL